MGRRRRAREDALKVLYQIDVTAPADSSESDADIEQVLADYWESQGGEDLDPERREFAEQISRGVLDDLGEIDGLIRTHAHNWRIERLAAVDRNILRVGIYELLHERDVPWAVVINEAIEIARRYSTDESSQFINGILDAVHRALEAREEPSREAG